MSAVGPITFSHPVAREQLQSHGHVVTFRASERTTGETWWRKERLGEKQGDVRVVGLGSVTPCAEDIARFAPLSGFDTPYEWADAIHDINGDVSNGYLYRVDAIDPDV